EPMDGGRPAPRGRAPCARSVHCFAARGHHRAAEARRLRHERRGRSARAVLYEHRAFREAPAHDRRPPDGSGGLITDREIWRAALLMVKRYKDDAMLEASMRADQNFDKGNMPGAETWHRVLNCVERILATKPGEGEGVH